LVSEKFKEYVFIDEEHVIFWGRMVRYRFPNGFGASVIENSESYGVELAVLEFSESEYGCITMSTEITDDVIGFIEDEELDEILERISRLGEDGKEDS
jgi:hypothetical protein